MDGPFNDSALFMAVASIFLMGVHLNDSAPCMAVVSIVFNGWPS
jgi:hypothetical protein